MKKFILFFAVQLCLGWGAGFAADTADCPSILSEAIDPVGVEYQLALKILDGAKPLMEEEMGQSLSNGYLVSRYNRGLVTIDELGPTGYGGDQYLVTYGDCSVIVTIGDI